VLDLAGQIQFSHFDGRADIQSEQSGKAPWNKIYRTILTWKTSIPMENSDSHALIWLRLNVCKASSHTIGCIASSNSNITLLSCAILFLKHPILSLLLERVDDGGKFISRRWYHAIQPQISVYMGQPCQASPSDYACIGLSNGWLVGCGLASN
jgi:hypothetical protein